MQALIDFIIRNLLALWPIAQVYEWECGMMVRRGKIQRVLSPGLHWRWWFIDEKRTWAATECVISLPTGAVTTADGESIAIDGNLGYRLHDIVMSWRTCWNMDASVKALAQGVICSHLATRTWPELQGDARKTVEAHLVTLLNEQTAVWGIEVSRVHLVACVRARQHRHFIDGALAH